MRSVIQCFDGPRRAAPDLDQGASSSRSAKGGRSVAEVESPLNGGRVHERAQQHIIEMIEGPDYSAGDRIPSERDLAERYRISRMTMRKAIDKLVAKGLLERRGTSGT